MECEIVLSATNETIGVARQLAAWLTPTVAIVGLVIALQQSWTNKKRLRHELFDRRYEQFSAIRDFLAYVALGGRVDQERQVEFISATRGSLFIFGKHISDYVESVWKDSLKIQRIEAELEGLSVGDERTSKVREQREILDRLNDDLKNLETKFSRYLRLRH